MLRSDLKPCKFFEYRKKLIIFRGIRNPFPLFNLFNSMLLACGFMQCKRFANSPFQLFHTHVGIFVKVDTQRKYSAICDLHVLLWRLGS